jgi:hypothetical protein
MVHVPPTMLTTTYAAAVMPSSAIKEVQLTRSGLAEACKHRFFVIAY